MRRMRCHLAMRRVMASLCLSLLAGCLSESQDSVDDQVLESLARNLSASYEVDAEGGLVTVERPRLGALTVQAPLDLTLNDNLIHVCVNWLGPASCDYLLNSPRTYVKIPLKGSISVMSSHVFDEGVITQFRDDLNSGVLRPDAGSLKLVLTQVGNDCSVINGNTLVPSMALFWNNVSLSSDKKTFSWDLTHTNSAVFDESCSQTQAPVKLTLHIVLPLISAGILYRTSVTLTNDPVVVRPDYIFKPIMVTNP